MTILVVAAAVFLALLASRRFVEAAEDVGYPEDARTSAGRMRIALVSGLSTFALVVGAWLALAPTSA
jgi:hypothetical protein